MTDRAHICDHAILRYLERAHGLDVDAVRKHMAGLTVTAVRLGAIAVQVEHVKIVLARHSRGATAVTVIAPHAHVAWPSRTRADEDGQ